VLEISILDYIQTICKTTQKTMTKENPTLLHLLNINSYLIQMNSGKSSDSIIIFNYYFSLR